MNTTMPAEFIRLNRDLWINAVPIPKRPEVSVFLAAAQDMISGLTVPRPSARSWRYGSIPQFVLTEGKAFSAEPFTDAEMRILQSLAGLDLRYLRPTLCFRNAYMVSRNIPELHYVEGLVNYHGCLLLHAWLDLNGKPIDVTYSTDFTMVPCRNIAQMIRRIDDNRQTFRYYGIEFSGAEVTRHVLGRKTYDSIIDCVACNHSFLRRGLGAIAVGDHTARVAPCTW
ncbi:MAG: hypothetical protein NDJ72_00165 [Elusimicrobia bacterium]|nr:hypothetical protein [Elusimicrobiota bacterium]